MALFWFWAIILPACAGLGLGMLSYNLHPDMALDAASDDDLRAEYPSPEKINLPHYGRTQLLTRQVQAPDHLTLPNMLRCWGLGCRM